MLVTLKHKSSKSHGPLAIHQHPSLYSGVSVLCMCMHQANLQMVSYVGQQLSTNLLLLMSSHSCQQNKDLEGPTHSYV